jgi:hypothetical protein
MEQALRLEIVKAIKAMRKRMFLNFIILSWIWFILIRDRMFILYEFCKEWEKIRK